jgi:hypothetical protein
MDCIVLIKVIHYMPRFVGDTALCSAGSIATIACSILCCFHLRYRSVKTRQGIVGKEEVGCADAG